MSGGTRLAWRSHSAILLLLLVATPLYFWWTWSGGLGQPFGDGPNYLMQAEHYSLFRHADRVHAEAATQSRYPPLFPLLLAAIDGATHLHRAHAAGTACLLLALLVYYAWMVQEGLRKDHAPLLVLAFAAMPGSWLAGLSIQSEYPYLLLSQIAVLLMTRYRLDANREILFGAALAVGAAILTRSVGVTLLPPLLILLWRTPKRIGAVALTIALAPPLLWHLVHRPDLGYSDSLGIYTGNLWSGLRVQLGTELPALRAGFAGNFLPFPFLRAPADVLGLVCLVAMLRRAWALKLDAIYLLGHLAVLLLWPYPEEAQRFLWVLMPFLLAQPVLCAAQGHKEFSTANTLSIAGVAGVALVMSLPGVKLAADRYRSAAYTDLPHAETYATWYDPDQAHAVLVTGMQVSFINAMQAIPEYVPDADCVVAIRPDLVKYYGRRRSRFPPLNSVPDPDFLSALRQSGCQYIVGVSGKDRRFPVPFHPLLRLGTNAELVFRSTVPDNAGDADLLIVALMRLKQDSQ